MDSRRSWLLAVGFAVLSLLLVRSIAAVPYIPTNDGPESILAVHIDNHYSDADEPLYRAVFLPAPQYASRGFTLLYGPFEEWLGWRVGLQVSLAIIVLATAWGFYALGRAIDPRQTALAFIGFPLALTWELYMGFFAFTVGSAVGLFVLTLAVRWRPPTRGRRAALAGLLLLQAFCHVFSAVLTGFVIGILFLCRAPRGGRLAELGRLALMGAPAGAILAGSASNGAALRAIPFANEYDVLPVGATSVAFPHIVAPGPWWRAIIVVGLLVAALVCGTLRLWRPGASTTTRALFIAGIVLLAAGVASPIHIPGWQYFSPRFVPLGTLLCLVTLPFDAGAGRNWAVARAVALFTFSSAYLMASVGLHRRLAASCVDEIAGLSAPVARRGVWLPVALAPVGGMSLDLFASEVPFLAPLWHMPALYAVVEGGLTPYSFANNAATFPIVIRPDAVKPPLVPSRVKYSEELGSEEFAVDAAFRRQVQDELSIYGMFYEGILLMGARPRDISQWRARGYETDWARGTVLVAHFVPCPLDVTLSAPVDRAPLLDVGIGAQTIFRDESLPLVTGESGSAHVQLPRSPCGAVWVRPHWDTTLADGTAKREYCKNARQDGEILATLTRESSRVTCERSPSP